MTINKKSILTTEIDMVCIFSQTKRKPDLIAARQIKRKRSNQVRSIVFATDVQEVV